MHCSYFLFYLQHSISVINPVILRGLYYVACYFHSESNNCELESKVVKILCEEFFFKYFWYFIKNELVLFQRLTTVCVTELI